MMKKIFLSILSLFFSVSLFSQQLYLQASTARNITKYGTAPFSDSPEGYFTLGLRLAAGADHFQIGGEYHQNITDPKWMEVDDQGNDLGQTSFSTNYIGAFLRTKISRYPALRFGLVLRVGAGFYNSERNTTVLGRNPTDKYEQSLGFNGGVAVSFPVIDKVMLDLGYAYYYADFDETEVLESLQGSYHSLQAGLSLNLVFGKRAEQYRLIKENRYK